MADGVVSSFVGRISGGVVSYLLQKIAEEASSLRGVSGEIDGVKRELTSMQSFIKDAETKKQLSEGVRNWTMEVRDVAYKVEDIIDEFMYCMEKQQRHHRFRMGFLLKAIHLPKTIFVRHQFATQLQVVKKEIYEISERRKRYGLEKIEEGSSSSNDDTQRRRRYAESSLFIEEDELVGIEKNKDKLVRWLIEEEASLKLLPVVGMGGLGKTTLVTQAYKSQVEVKKHFQCHAWISVSQSFRIEELLKRLIKELFDENMGAAPNEIGVMDFRQLVETIKSYLQGKRYVVVLDDVWTLDVWPQIRAAFPDDKRGSRVMLTTRQVDVASSFSSSSSSGGIRSPVFHVEPLLEDEAFILFCKKAFWNIPERRCPRELESSTRRIVGKCQGLPLAIVALGSLMALKENTVLEWKKVENSLGWEISNNPMLERVKSILLLSFNNLPYYLKHCFLYCSIFPEDHLIRRARLIRLWVAEGFVEERRGLTMEEAAEHYLNELIFRSMLQVANETIDGRVKECRMHDLLRELALSTSENEGFSMVSDGQEASVGGRVRRLSVHKIRDNIPSSTGASQLRSFFMFVNDTISSSTLNKITSSFRLLRVLDLENSSISSVPDILGDLFNLRYLSFHRTTVRELPKSLGKLCNLQTLDLRRTQIEQLPGEVLKLQKLRHLIAFRILDETFSRFDYGVGVLLPTEIWKLRSLQSLSDVKANGEIVKHVGNLTQLRKLGIEMVRREDGIELCASITKMTCLQILDVTTANEEEALDLESLSPPPSLHNIALCGPLENLPRWFLTLENLTQLMLHWSRLRDDPLAFLGPLPNLTRLILRKAYDGQELCFHAGDFPKLKRLLMCDMVQLNFIRMEEGTMQSIEEIELERCGELKMLPCGIEYLTTLKELYLVETSEELVARLRTDESGDRLKVSHIPIIRHFFSEEGKRYYKDL
ncbi:disease resistance protein RPM1-like isoform X1 [Tasmannia lanceolata]|uniref:disease resistance protein RPM1-like isoform X1 n=1 Tax=Tasmannia lanceolata TaxID=3420 RepID=UPI004063997C